VNPDESAEPFRDAPGAAPDALGDLTAGYARRSGWEARLREARVHALWEEIAGRQVAQHVRPVRLHGGVLVLQADSPAWATQIRYLATKIVQRANSVLGAAMVTQVTVRAGATEPSRRGPRRSR
jgi:predicted nucleic acid-binding Zn ribbon protein